MIDRPDVSGHQSVPGCLIVNGTPGAGKTTVSRLVAGRLPRAARIDGDDVNQMIVTGRVGPVSEPADEAQRQLLLRARNICSLANNFAGAGFTPIIDHVVPDQEILDFMIGALTVRPVALVNLNPDLDVARRRNTSRPAIEQVSYDFKDLRESMARGLKDVGWWFDTSDLSPEDTAAEVIARAHERGVVAR